MRMSNLVLDLAIENFKSIPLLVELLLWILGETRNTTLIF